MKGPLAGLMQQAQKMQENMQRAQEELAQKEISGQAGGGLVTVTMNGRHETKRIKIDAALLTGDVEMLEDLLVAACNDANNKVADLSQKHMGELTGGLNLPAGFKMPF